MTDPQPSRSGVDLRRPRDVGALIGDAFTVYLREFRTFVLIALAVVVPVNLIVEGVGLGHLTSDYDASPTQAEMIIPILSNFLLVVPLTSAMCIYALLDLADGERPRAGSAIQRGLDVFAPLLVVMLLYAGTLILGLLALIVGALVALVFFGFCIQAAVIDQRRGADALRRSWQIVRPAWLRVAGITILSYLLVGVLSALVGAPFLSLADSSDRAVYGLIGQTLGGVLFTPPAVLITTLLYFDQRLKTGV